jgi:hypothetical protein
MRLMTGWMRGLENEWMQNETIHWCMWYLAADAVAGSLFKDRVFVAEASLRRDLRTYAVDGATPDDLHRLIVKLEQLDPDAAAHSLAAFLRESTRDAIEGAGL